MEHMNINRTVYGIGYLTKHKAKDNVRLYKLWKNMLERVYSEKCHNRHPSYIGCTVDSSWHSFDQFIEDIKDMEGYEMWLDPLNKYELDKDIKYDGNKHYSKDNCLFVSNKDNMSERNKRVSITGIEYKATRISDGYTEVFTNQSEFAKKYGFIRRDLCYTLTTSKNKERNGWIFE